VDLGKSGSQAAGRDGFQKLVSEVALGKAGLGHGAGGIHALAPELRRLAQADRAVLSGRRAHSLTKTGYTIRRILMTGSLLGLKGNHVGSRTSLP